MQTINSNGVHLGWQSIGQGEPVLFSNGIMMTMDAWTFVTNELSKQYRCILFDHRGQLHSDKPEETNQYSYPIHADDIAALLDQIGLKRVHLIGTSYGGHVGITFAARYPEYVQSLQIISSVASGSTHRTALFNRWLDVIENRRERVFEETVNDNYSAAFMASHERMLNRTREWYSSLPADYYEGLLRLLPVVRDIDIRAELPRVQCPTWVTVGDQDAICETDASRAIANGIPGAEFEIMENAGHALVIEAAEQLNQKLIQFLRKHAF